jgi:Fe2+ or Zn2+ uptake regulation protein
MRNQLQLDELLNYMLRQGLRITAQRKVMLGLILRFKRPFTAMQLYQAMEKKFHGLSYGTVYQNLKLLRKLRIIDTVAISNEVRYRVIYQVQPQFHFICMDCEKTIPVDFNPVQAGLPLPEHFQSVNYQLDVFGYCTDCNLSGERKSL